MNLKYFELPIDKQKKIVNGGYKLFALFPYKKASMAAIADEANISKSLLFYYFKNKKEYYLFLFETAIKFTNEKRVESIQEKKYDLFELINQNVKCRMKMIRDYPYLYKFMTRAYYETFEDIKFELDIKKKTITQIGKEEILNLIDHNRFKNANDVQVLFNIILSIAEGCMRGCEDLDIVKTQRIIEEFNCMMESLKKHYYKE
jgi:AcrR family transcriptional regulator